MKSFHPTPKDIENNWFYVDAEGQTLGRLASRVATVLRGKHKATYTPSADMGDFVIITNANKIKVTGAKLEDKKYYHHTGYIGGIKEINLESLLEKKPEEALKKAIYGMMPKGPLGRKMFSKLKVYEGSEHPHSAQQPESLTI